jgi:peroxiredoxin (alkyl hydroperoxide reductase subunit C)
MFSTTSDFTFVCPTEIPAFNDALPDFARINTTVLLGTSLPLLHVPPRAAADTTRLASSHALATHALAAISTNSEYSHHAWSQQPRTAGGLGPDLRIPLLADRSMGVAREYGCLIEDKGIARELFDRSQGRAATNHHE